MAGKNLTDDILHIFNATSVMTAGTTVSLEIDLEIPRGYVAYIEQVEIGTKKLGEDFEAGGADGLVQIQAALVRDPDDTTTVAIPEEATVHDVIAELEHEILVDFTTSGMVMGDFNVVKFYDYTAGELDVFTARNMRLNCVGSGSQVAVLTETEVYCNILYTLEKVSDAQLLALLDIL